jgi:hypothetical protein
MLGEHGDYRENTLLVIQGIRRGILGGVPGLVSGVVVSGVVLGDRAFYFQFVYRDEDTRQLIVTNGLCSFAAVGQTLPTRGGYAES